MSATNAGTPCAESCSAMPCSVFVLPVPVAPATSPWRFIIDSAIWTFASWATTSSRTPRPRSIEAPSTAYAAAIVEAKSVIWAVTLPRGASAQQPATDRTSGRSRRA